ncbi:MAG TPA: hypothetical protein VM010_03645 [Chitinophagaceae bacterium]|nr:hypothetical protein [Chitinophagaceae bacterium]
MSDDNKKGAQTESGKHEHPLPQEINSADKKTVEAAHEQAEQDMEQDADLSIHSPNDDLDEGETARLGNDVNPLI